MLEFGYLKQGMMVKGMLGIASIVIMNACTGCNGTSETTPANLIYSSIENYAQTNNYNNVTSYDYEIVNKSFDKNKKTEEVTVNAIMHCTTGDIIAENTMVFQYNESSQNWNIIEDGNWHTQDRNDETVKIVEDQSKTQDFVAAENVSYTSYEEDDAVLENDYNSALTEDIDRRDLDVPDYDDVTIEYTMPDYDDETETYAEPEEEYEETDYNNSGVTRYDGRLEDLDNQIGDAVYYPQEYFEMCDELLNDVYQDIKEELSDSDYEELKQSELSWLDDREQIDSSGDEYWFTMASETLNRVHWLLENYGYCVDR